MSGPSVHDIPKIHKLLRKRAKLTQKIARLQKGTVVKAKVILKPDEQRPATSSKAANSVESWVFVRIYGDNTSAKNKPPSLSFKEDESGLIKEFFLRRYFDDLATIDQELFDLGFVFPETAKATGGAE